MAPGPRFAPSGLELGVRVVGLNTWSVQSGLSCTLRYVQLRLRSCLCAELFLKMHVFVSTVVSCSEQRSLGRTEGVWSVGERRRVRPGKRAPSWSAQSQLVALPLAEPSSCRRPAAPSAALRPLHQELPGQEVGGPGPPGSGVWGRLQSGSGPALSGERRAQRSTSTRLLPSGSDGACDPRSAAAATPGCGT